VFVEVSRLQTDRQADTEA